MNQLKRKKIFHQLRIKYPKPTTELEWSTPFELLVSVMLSARATDISVNKVTRKLYTVAKTPEEILSLGLSGLREYIKSIGLFNSKARHIIGACQVLIDSHNGQVKEDRVALEALPGVGRKTANVVLNTAFGQPTIAVDTHVFRVSNRTKLAVGKNVYAVEDKLIQVVPKEFKYDVHHWLVLHGRYTCTARKPHCNNCVIESLCEFKEKRFEPRPR